jgi:hypothetical protein
MVEFLPDANTALAGKARIQQLSEIYSQSKAIETVPRSRIHRGASGLFSFAVWSSGFHINNPVVPNAKQLTAAKLAKIRPAVVGPVTPSV